MRAIVAYRGRDDGGESLELAAMLRRSTGADLRVVGVYPPVSDHPGIQRVDLEYREWLSGLADTARAEVQARLWPDDPDDLSYESVTSTSVAAGLVHAAEAAQADVIVLGSARAAVSGSLLLGSVGSRLLHSSPVPLLLASPGYHAPDDASFGCLTVAYAGTDRSRRLFTREPPLRRGTARPCASRRSCRARRPCIRRRSASTPRTWSPPNGPSRRPICWTTLST